MATSRRLPNALFGISDGYRSDSGTYTLPLMQQLRANLSRMMVFVRVVDTGSFTAAARDLNVARSVVSEAVTALEEDIGCRLIHRSTRSLRLTEVGEAFVERCQRMVVEAQGAFDAVAANQERPTGILRVSSPRCISEILLAPVLADLAVEHQIQAEVRVDDRRLNLLDEGFDASIRVSKTPTPGQIVRKLGKSPEILLAAPARAASIQTIEDLKRQPWICHVEISEQLTLHGPGRKKTIVSMNPQVRINDISTMSVLLQTGMGVGMMPLVLVHEALQSGALVQLLPQYRISLVHLLILLPTRKHLPLRTRLLIEGLQERIKQLLPV